MSEKLLAYASSQVILVIVLAKENLLLSNIEIRMQFVHIKFQQVDILISKNQALQIFYLV